MKIKSVLTLLLLLLGCYTLSAQIKHITITPDEVYQSIDNFAAADAWCGNFVGKFWNEESKEQISEWLFSREFDEIGKPKGIGLSLWRVNVGAGTWEQADCDIMPIQRRAESFLTSDGQYYDWGKCAGQLYFMKKAQEKGCNNFLLFSNSPLIQYTLNGKGYSSGHKANIKSPDGYTKYGKYLAEVANHLKKDGFNISYISPINEPQGDWVKPTQEGSPWLKSEMKNMYVALDSAMSYYSNLSDVKILFGECSNIPVVYSKTERVTDLFKDVDNGPHDIVKSFFDSSSPYYIGNLKHLPRLVAAHTYHNHTKNSEMKEVRSRVKEICGKYNVSYQETEWCMLPIYNENMDGFTKDWNPGNRGDIQVALLMGRLIYTDIVYSGAEAWGYWKGMEIEGNHSLIALYPKDGNLFYGGNVSANKILWALGNYSLFVRPGYKRVSLTGADDLDRMVASAYISPSNNKIVIVFVNSGFNDEEIILSMPNKIRKKVNKARVYITDESKDLSPEDILDIKSSLKIPQRSLVTIVIDF